MFFKEGGLDEGAVVDEAVGEFYGELAGAFGVAEGEGEGGAGGGCEEVDEFCGCEGFLGDAVDGEDGGADDDSGFVGGAVFFYGGDEGGLGVFAEAEAE